MASLRFGFGLSAAAGVAAIALSGSPAEARFLYGSANDGNIYEIDTISRTTRFVIPTGFTAGGGDTTVNALANDRARNNLFFITPENNLRVLRQGTGTTLSVAAAAQLGLTNPQSDPTNFPQNAAFYNGDYYFFSRQPTDTTPILNRISFNYSGNTPSFAGRITYSLPNVPNTGVDGSSTRNNYGDIAITSGGLLFGATSIGSPTPNNSRFFRLDLAGLIANTNNGNYTQIDATLGQSYQIAFNEAYTTLFGVQTIGSGAGNWRTISLTDGAIGTFPGGNFSSNLNFFDISDSATPVRIPGPLPLLGAAAAFGWSRKLRKRINGTLQDS